MRAILFLSLLVACGDNLHAGTDTDAGTDAVAADATPDTQGLADAMPSVCPTDTVSVLNPGTPGTDPSDYPAPGWWLDDTRAHGMVTVDDALGAPPGFGCRSARLVTGDSTASPSADKAQLLSFEQHGAALSTINTISYWAFRSSASTGGAPVDLALNVSITGATVPGNFATLTYEPYFQSTGNTGVMSNVWQHWDATATTAGDGLWWTTKIPNGTPGSQSMPQPWAAFQALYSDAKVHGYGFNLGSFNPNMVTAGDGLVFGTTTTNF